MGDVNFLLPNDKFPYIYIHMMDCKPEDYTKYYQPIERWLVDNFIHKIKNGWTFYVSRKKIIFYFSNKIDATFFRLFFPYKTITKNEYVGNKNS